MGYSASDSKSGGRSLEEALCVVSDSKRPPRVRLEKPGLWHLVELKFLGTWLVRGLGLGISSNRAHLDTTTLAMF